MSWSSKRRSLYLGGIILFFVVVLAWISFGAFYEAPTCFDEKQNSDEEGIDCGGSCDRVCGFQAVDPIVLWNRFFEVAPGYYSALALIENPNTNTHADPIPYTFKIRDKENVLIYERKGQTGIPQERLLPIFETGIITGERFPVRSTFEFDRAPDWQRTDSERPRITFSGTVLSKEDALPRLRTTIQNESIEPVSDIILVAVLSGADGNAVAASQTVVSYLGAGAQESVVFTWRQPFAVPITSIDIIPKFPLAE